jgi:hypothetical protein
MNMTILLPVKPTYPQTTIQHIECSNMNTIISDLDRENTQNPAMFQSDKQIVLQTGGVFTPLHWCGLMP